MTNLTKNQDSAFLIAMQAFSHDMQPVFSYKGYLLCLNFSSNSLLTSLLPSFLRAFSYTAPRLPNRLPALLKELDSIATNKTKLKTFMFEKTFDLSDQSMNKRYGL